VEIAMQLHVRHYLPQNRVARRAFSLLELLAVVTILGILASLVLPRLSGQAVTAKGKVCSQYVGDLNGAIEKYYIDHGTYPASVNDLQDDRYYPAAIPVCPVTGQPFAIDTNTHSVRPHNH
jgi:prepilin-type N-terminal cleavage/methylation domain-containing protein